MPPPLSAKLSAQMKTSNRQADLPPEFSVSQLKLSTKTEGCHLNVTLLAFHAWSPTSIPPLSSVSTTEALSIRESYT